MEDMTGDDLSRYEQKKVALAKALEPIIYVIMIVILGIFVFEITNSSDHAIDDVARQRAVADALRDPTFLASAAKAGYRVERPLRSRKEDLIARCARSDRDGPLPCDPFPTGLYPSIPGNAEIVVRTIP
jgi:hypothetical protein